MNDLSESEMIDLSLFKGEIYVVLLKRFGGDSEVDLRVTFLKVCEGFE